jgi:large subunit ribosomal protein L7/L12
MMSENVNNIAESIIKLNLMEVAALTKKLKEDLNLPDVSFASPSNNASSNTAEAKKEEAPSKFTITLKKHGEKKTDAIKALKVIFKQALNQDFNIIELRNKVDALPLEVLKDLPKEKADEYVKLLSEAGCECELKAS